jgi:hypothetical protein
MSAVSNPAFERDSPRSGRAPQFYVRRRKFDKLPGDTMNIKWLTRTFIGIGIVSTFMYLSYLGVRFAKFEFNGGNVFGITLLLSPYIVWAFINESRHNVFSKRPNVYIGLAIAMPAIGFGVTYYAVLFPDAQNAFLILYIPFMQFMCLAAAWGFCKKRKTTGSLL